MKIESIIQRADGTEVILDKKTYRFVPEYPGGPHVCTVQNEKHVAMLLRIREGYRPASMSKFAQKAQATSQPAQIAENASGREMAPIVLGDDDLDEAGDDEGDEEDLPPIEQEKVSEKTEIAVIEADRAEYLALMQKEAVARAAELQAFNDADAGLDLGTHDTDEVEVVEPDGSGEEEEDMMDDEADGLSGPITRESLEAKDRTDLLEIYESIIGQKPGARASKAMLVTAILENTGN